MNNLQRIVLPDFRGNGFGRVIALGIAATFVRVLFISFLNSFIIHSRASFFLIVIAGAAEGFAIAALQYRSWTKSNSHFNIAVWIGTSIIGSVFAWLIILQPAFTLFSVLSALNMISVLAAICYIGLMGMLFGAVIGLAQYLSIRKIYNYGVGSIISKAMEWMCLCLVATAGYLIFNEVHSILSKTMAVVGTCLFSGLIQMFVMYDPFHGINHLPGAVLSPVTINPRANSKLNKTALS
jgi:hypothetical protein